MPNSRVDSLAARIALGLIVLVATVVGISIGVMALTLRGHVNRTLHRELAAASQTADLMLSSKSDVLKAVGLSLATAPLLSSAVAAGADTAALNELARQRMDAVKVDWVAVLSPDRKVLGTSQIVPAGTDLAALRPNEMHQIAVGGQVYLAVLHELSLGRQSLGYTLAAQKLGRDFARSLARETGAEVLVTSAKGVVASSLSPANEVNLHDVTANEGVQERGPLRILALQRGLLTLVFVRDSDEAISSFRDALSVLLMVGAAAAALAGLLGLALVRRVTLPLHHLAATVDRVVSDGDFTQRLELTSTSEIRQLAQSFSQVIAMLRDLLQQIRAASGRINTSTAGLAATVLKSEGAANEHVSGVRTTSVASNELAQSARRIAQSSEAVADIAGQTLFAARSGLEGAALFTGSMKRLRDEHQTAAMMMQELSTRIQQIGRVVEFINGVADKSELLALNAELEGQRAGAVGEGFSLVATEMRRLAENVGRSTREIEALIDDVKTATEQAVGATRAGNMATAQATAAASAVVTSLRQITTLAETTATSVGDISGSTRDQTSSTDQLARSLARMHELASDSLQSARTLAGANADLTVLARELDQLVVPFKL